MLTLQIISVLVALLLGVVVVMRDPRDRNRWLLLLFNVVVALWIISGIFADMPGDSGLFWNRLVFVEALLTCLLGYLLLASLANRLNIYTWWVSLLTLGWSAVIILTPFVVADTQERVVGGVVQGLDAVRGSGYFAYILSIVAIGVGVILFAFYLMRHSHGRFKSQLKVIFSGFISIMVVGLITGVVLPLALQSSAPASLTFFVLLIAIAVFTYAIVRQRLFDIRLAIARSLGYFLALAAIAVFYAAAIFGLADILFTEQDADTGLRIYYVVAALFVAMTFWPLKRFFSRLTSRVFFRDTYDTEEVFSNLTASLVGTVDIDVLAQRASHILQRALKVDFLRIVPAEHGGEQQALLKSIKALNQPLIVTDELSARHKSTADKLYEANIALVARLQTHQELVGYLVCGPKTRGDALTNQDVELMRVASGELAVAVQNALRFEEISHFNEKLKKEIEEATTQLRDSNRKLKKLDEAKDEFIGMASHQLRTPLTSIKGYLSMVLDGDAGSLNQQQHRLLQESFTAAQRMVYLISDFLNVSRLQTGRFELEPKPTNLARIVSDEVDQLAGTAKRREITVHYNRPAQFPTQELDENKIRQVIMNFIDNAVYYSHPGGKVEIVLVSTGREIRFEVHDNGIGVPENERHKIFTKFFRAANARHIRPDGTGIGLFMAKKVITAHGGSILLKTKENKGSTFGFVLPLHQQPDKLNQQPDNQ